jgi:hypothetical protein
MLTHPYQPNQIDSFQELDSLLADDFILLCGSAISAGSTDNRGVFVPFLPMVGTATERFYLDFHEFLRNEDYLYKLLSIYALEIAKGRYQSRRLRRKFEDFLWKLEQVMGVDSVIEFLSSLFYCEQGQYLPNHIAIANLLAQGRVRICLTTNFDNAIESANRKIIRLVHSKDFWIDSIPGNPTLLKLHGDVIEGNYIATIPQLITAEGAQSFSYLEKLLNNKTVLVAGYSGNGDVDIAPHLRKIKKTGARLIWLVKPGGAPSDIATDWFVSDLCSSDNEKNCLLRLGDVTNAKETAENIFKPPWEERLKNWSAKILSQLSVKQMIDVLDQVSGFAAFQLYFVNKWGSQKAGERVGPDVDLLEFSRKCLGIGTYYSSLSAIRRIDRANIQKLGLHNELLFIKGFSNWRLVRLMEASNELRYFDYLDENDLKGELEKNAFRVYVEVLREIIGSYASMLDAYDFYYDHHVGDSCNKLLSMLEGSDDPGNKMLSTLVVLDIERRIGRKGNIDTYRELYQRALDLQLWAFARTAARSILQINMIEGMAKIRLTHRIAGETLTWHSIKHNTLAVLDKFPKVLINPAHIANIILSGIPVLAREVSLFFRKFLWYACYRLSIIVV